MPTYAIRYSISGDPKDKRADNIGSFIKYGESEQAIEPLVADHMRYIRKGAVARNAVITDLFRVS